MSYPNIVYIHSHDTGRFIGPCGHKIDTPHFDRLAREGVVFRKAFCVAPTCSPSRAGLLTGISPHCSGMLGLAHLGWRLDDYGKHLIHTLHAAGYTSALAGIQHIAHQPAAHPEDIGYHELLTPPTHDGVLIAGKAAEYVQRGHDRPFFLSVGFFETHREFPAADPADDPRYVLVPPGIPDTADNRADMARFQTSARRLDDHVGRVLEALRAADLEDTTLVIATTDHGLAMPGMKCELTDQGTGVYLLMRGPGGFDGGRVTDAMVSHLDIFPTVCELLGIEVPARLQGRSLLPLVRGVAEEIHEELFAEVTYHAAYEPKRAVRTHRWKYIRRFDRHFHTPVLPNCDDSPPKSLWLSATDWRSQKLPEESLHDLLLDPMERENLAGRPEHAGVLGEMRARLQAWMERTNDPLLNGDVPLPACGFAWSQSALSPSRT